LAQKKLKNRGFHI